MNILIPVASGIEAAAKREIERMGLGHAPAVRGRIELEGGWETVARLNVFLRAGERVLLEIGRIRAETFDELFDGTQALPWEEYLSAHTKILIDGKSFKSKLAAIKAAGGVVKKAIVSRLKEKLRVATLDESGERAVVGVSIFEDVATLTLDTSGDGLHKRGYRVLSYDAPLRETTAAAIIEDSFYRREKAFSDPFCGSGTLPIEAALYARGIAPGKSRTFDFERWKCTPKGAIARAKEEAVASEFHGEIAPIYASDLSPRAVSIAKEHAKRANVLKDIRFTAGDMRNFSAQERCGVLISNPPYGERMEAGEDLFPLYRDFAHMVKRLPDWSAYVISAYEGCERAFGRPDKRRILYNANLKCSLLAFFGKKPKNPRI
ncbi:MAG: class I SAM-dependent RNA methyltransferase [Clostridia bacterium]|nr:class I SAM-dependent RNA methyltransferase [Clostridia bacterium]